VGLPGVEGWEKEGLRCQGLPCLRVYVCVCVCMCVYVCVCDCEHVSEANVLCVYVCV